MIEFNQTLILFLIGFLFITIGILSGAVIFFYLRSKTPSIPTHEQTDETPSDIQDVNIQSNCLIHEDQLSKATCCICEDNFCDTCIQEWDGLNFCTEHLRLFGNNKWVGVTNIKTTPNDPEAASHVYKFKRHQWSESDIPSYIVTHYKINFEDDYIESYVMLFVRSQDEELFKQKLNSFN